MALKLHIPRCIDNPRDPNHFPSLEKPLRFCIQGLTVSIQKLLPKNQFTHETTHDKWFQPAAAELARLTFKAVYGRALQKSEVLVVRDEYLAWVGAPPREKIEIDYYGVTFDHLVPKGDEDPEVLALSIIEMDDDNGEFMRDVLRFQVDPEEYRGCKVLVVPRCCQKKKGKEDRGRINGQVIQRRERGLHPSLTVHGLGEEDKEEQKEATA